MIFFRPREFRVVSCQSCRWRDWYQIGLRVSYPPRCPECGDACFHEFVMQDKYIAPDLLRRLGHDEGYHRLLGGMQRSGNVPIRRARDAGWISGGPLRRDLSEA